MHLLDVYVLQVNGPTSIEAAASINNLAAQLHCMGKYGAAMQLYLRALKIWKVPANASSTQLQVVDVLCNLGLVARACGELQEAIGYVKVKFPLYLGLRFLGFENLFP